MRKNCGYSSPCRRRMLGRRRTISYCFHKYLTGIILGIKCRKDAESVKKIVELFRKDGDGSIQVYQAQYSEKTFDVLVPGIDKALGTP